MRKTDQILRDYDPAIDSGIPASLDRVRNLSYLLGFLSIFFASASSNYQASLLGWPLGDGEPAWHIRPFSFPVFEVAYFVLGAWVVVSTWTGKWLTEAHYVTSAGWVITSLIWVTYGILYKPDYVFAFGIVALFLATLHVIVAQIWKIERVV